MYTTKAIVHCLRSYHQRIDTLEAQIKKMETTLMTLSSVAQTDLSKLVNDFNEAVMSFDGLKDPALHELLEKVSDWPNSLPKIDKDIAPTTCSKTANEKLQELMDQVASLQTQFDKLNPTFIKLRDLLAAIKD